MYRVKELTTSSIQKLKPMKYLLLHNAAEAASLGPTKKTEKPRLVVLGSGWAGCSVLKRINTNVYDVVCISPRDHIVFTPLLASAAVCSLEVSTVCESVGRIQPALYNKPGCHFYLANYKAVDFINHQVHCQSIETDTSPPGELESMDFKVSYDKLVIASGAEATTFGIKGVEEHAFFLREVHHAQEIRRKLLLNLMLADAPGVPVEEKRRLLHCVVVGGGPAGTEFCAELSDFIKKEVHTRHPNFKGYTRVTLIEAHGILSSFHNRLRYCAIKKLTQEISNLIDKKIFALQTVDNVDLLKYGVHIIHRSVKEVQLNNILLSNGKVVPCGLVVWCAGVGPSSVITNLNLPKAPGGRIGVDNWLRVPSAPDVFAIGDCSGYLESTGKATHPALAQVAEREGKYLAKLLNKFGRAGCGHANCDIEMELGPQFAYRHLGSMATLSGYKAIVDLRQNKDGKGLSVTGFCGWLIWRVAYLTRVVSWRHRLFVAINWLTTFLFGRDISRV